MDSDENFQERDKPTTSRKGPPPRKKIKPMTPAEMMKKYRAAKSEEKKMEDKAKDLQRKT